MSDKMLKTRTLGKSGIKVTEIGLGLWAIGGSEWGKTDDSESLALIDRALDAGVNLFDTADVYGNGHSEDLLGGAMKGRRDKFVVATKIGWRNFDGEKKSSAYDTPKKLVAGIESNLVRLKTDYVDIIQSHINFRDPTMEVFLEGFRRCKKEGKVRAFGVSTSDFEYLEAFNNDDDCASLQIDYSILNRTAEEDIFPYCLKHKIGVIVRGALAMGILTGKFTSTSKFGEGDFRMNWIKDPVQNAIYKSDLEKTESLKKLAGTGTLSQLALRFTLAHPAVSVVIPGAKRPSQFDESLSALRCSPLSKKEMGEIDAIVPPCGGRKIWPA